jgi:hypothetical protein
VAQVGQQTAISEKDVRRFSMAWETLDPEWTGFIARWKTRPFLVRLKTVHSALAQDFTTDPEVRPRLAPLAWSARHESLSPKPSTLNHKPSTMPT